MNAPGTGGDVPTVAVASGLKYALEEIAAGFRAAEGRDVKLVFASSGGLYRRIEQGASFQLFMSADERLVRQLAAARLTQGRGRFGGVGRIVLFAPHHSRLALDPHLRGVRAAIARGVLKRLAIADPARAPYGRAAAEALRKSGLWHAARDSIAVMDNASQAAQLAAGGAFDGGIFAYSLALSGNVSRLGRYVVLYEGLHAPLRHRVTLLEGAGETARAFYRHLQRAPARAVLARHGLVP